MDKDFLIYLILILIVGVDKIKSACVCTDLRGYSKCSLFSTADMDVRINTAQSTATIELGTTRVLPINAVSFKDIQKLDLQCNISQLHTNSFANQEQLKDLDLSGNLLSDIPNDFFVNIPNLQKLNLSGNELENPSLDTFYALNNILTLDLSYNKIVFIQLGVLDEMSKLKKLYLNGNNIINLPLGLFDKSSALVTLDVSNNEQLKLALGLFDKSNSLREINLSGNKFFGKVHLGTYDSLKSIITLKVSNSKIIEFPLGVFDQALELQHLDLSKNILGTIPLGIFDKSIRLKVLNLLGCSLNEIPGGLFDQNPLLESLDLSYNKLKLLPKGLFNVNQELKFLNLSHNRINDLHLKLFQYTRLVEIDLSFNQLTTIKPELLNMETLERVHAQNNRISFLAHDTFATVGFPLKYLDISNNRLVFIEDKYFFEWLGNLKRMEIFGNPWDCICLDILLKSMSNRFIEYTGADYIKGKKPLCVDGKHNKCDVEMSDESRAEYYNIFVGINS